MAFDSVYLHRKQVDISTCRTELAVFPLQLR